ncbi:MAG: hypothetical protein PHD02_04895 [Bacilli bacterium]|nr:hypothetical protein [Bacilli bacterium]
MRYAFVLLSIIAIWIAVISIILALDYNGEVLPIVAIVMTVLLFEIGIGGKK